MTYVGFPIDIAEALCLLNLEEKFVKTFYDTEPIQEFLKDKKSKLVFCYIDKGSCLLGYPVARDRDHPSTWYKVDDMISQILKAKTAFKEEMKSLGIDISKINVTKVEEETFLDTSGEPYVITL